jgi:hypothetical protein
VSQYVAAVHDENDLDYDGWEVRTEELGHNPSHTGGTDYRGARHSVIARLNNGYYPNGTIPLPEHYEAFAVRVQSFVKNSAGCSHWVIGNEMNREPEWPYGRPIYPTDYGRCYTLCRDRIRSLPGHEDDQVIMGAVAPYNNQTAYPGNADGNWIVYFKDTLQACGVVDAIAIHAYSDGQHPSSITSNAKMGPPFEHLYSGYRAYRDFAHAIPDGMHHLPLYLTETNPGARGVPWVDQNMGWTRAAFSEIDAWNNEHPGRDFRCVALYSWDLRGDGMGFKNKPGVVEDFMQAAALGIEWPNAPLPTESPSPSPSPSPEPPTECLYDLDEIRQMIHEELAVLYTNLRDAMAEEIRKALDETIWTAKQGE